MFPTPHHTTQVTVIVLGTGDEVPADDAVVTQDQDEDVEDNMLRPPGVELETVDFVIKVVLFSVLSLTRVLLPCLSPWLFCSISSTCLSLVT